jgi:hypothetical protein
MGTVTATEMATATERLKKTQKKKAGPKISIQPFLYYNLETYAPKLSPQSGHVALLPGIKRVPQAGQTVSTAVSSNTASAVLRS